MNTKESFIQFIRNFQQEFCSLLQTIDGGQTFLFDAWDRPEGGGGISGILEAGAVFEKAGVNISEVEGVVTTPMIEQLNMHGHRWFACGVSVVIHPFNPHVPTVHCNYRYFELYDEAGKILDAWFGGGSDLTPYYLYEEDVILFHTELKKACDKADESFYEQFKNNCDEYFVNRHRNNERRGVGGIFYDHQRPAGQYDSGFWLQFATACYTALKQSYLPIVLKRQNLAFDESQKKWQEIRRGRYVEFNLLHDRGTIFGLKTNGRTESILMSLPPTVRFDYNFTPTQGSAEANLLDVLNTPRNWVIEN